MLEFGVGPGSAQHDRGPAEQQSGPGRPGRTVKPGLLPQFPGHLDRLDVLASRQNRASSTRAMERAVAPAQRDGLFAADLAAEGAARRAAVRSSAAANPPTPITSASPKRRTASAPCCGSGAARRGQGCSCRSWLQVAGSYLQVRRWWGSAAGSPSDCSRRGHQSRRRARPWLGCGRPSISRGGWRGLKKPW
jgi:hypothetical protein